MKGRLGKKGSSMLLVIFNHMKGNAQENTNKYYFPHTLFLFNSGEMNRVAKKSEYI